MDNSNNKNEEAIDKDRLQELAKSLDPFNPESINEWKEDLKKFGFQNLDNPFELSKEILKVLNKFDLL